MARTGLVITLLCAICHPCLSQEQRSRQFDADQALGLPLGLPADELHLPTDNPITSAKVELGRLLFFDVRLSFDDSVSCASCHAPQFAFTDGRKTSSGINDQEGGRSAPTAINRAFSAAQFWDGRASSLEEQAKGPLTNEIEMGMPDHRFVEDKIAGIRGYRERFKEVFGRNVHIDDIARAIASFERTILSGNSPRDQYVAGDKGALSESAARGLEIFEDKARCTQCHLAPLFTDEKYHNLGIDWDTDMVDLGRYRVTGRADDIGAFKTPTLREISHTGPYMHDGSLKTLEDTVKFYNDGGVQNPFLDVEMRRPTRGLEEMLQAFEDVSEKAVVPETELAKLDLSDQEQVDLVNFLKALGGQGWQHIEAPTSFPE